MWLRRDRQRFGCGNWDLLLLLINEKYQWNESSLAASFIVSHKISAVGHLLHRHHPIRVRALQRLHHSREAMVERTVIDVRTQSVAAQRTWTSRRLRPSTVAHHPVLVAQPAGRSFVRTGVDALHIDGGQLGNVLALERDVTIESRTGRIAC